MFAFADDCHVPLSPSHHHTLRNTLDILQRFYELSDLILNVKKTELMAVGHQPIMLQNARDFGLEIVDKIKFVGSTTFNSFPELDSDRNLEHGWSKFTKITNFFTSKYSTTVGSVIALNSICLSLFNHSLFNFIPEQTWIDTYKDKSTKFILNSTNGRFTVQKKRFYVPVIHGGHGIRDPVHHSTALMTYWIKQLQLKASPTNDWSAILDYHLDKLNLSTQDVLHLGHHDLRDISKLLTDSSSFWSAAFLKFSVISRLLEAECSNFSIIPLLGSTLSKHLRCRNCSFFSRSYNHKILFKL